MQPQASSKRLFTSSVRLELIQKLFYLPSEIYYVRQLVRLLDQEINAVRRELANLKNADLVFQDIRGNRIYYGTNTKSPIFHELVLLAHKTSGLGGFIYKSKDQLGNLEHILYSQTFLYNLPRLENYDKIDIIIVGKVILQEIEDIIKKEQELRGYEINYMVMDKQELALRRSRRDPLLIDFFMGLPSVIMGQSILLTGNDGTLPQSN